MTDLPEYVKQNIMDNQTILTWERRRKYELWEENAYSIWFAIAVILMGIDYSCTTRYQITRCDFPVQLWTAILIILVYLWWPTVIEHMRWFNEVYVVTQDDQTGNGRFYKFYGIFTKGYIDEPITAQSPTVIPHEHWWYRLWGWITGEKMVRITIKSQNHTYMEARRVSPKLVKSIGLVRSGKVMPRSTNSDITNLYDMTRIAMMTNGRWIPESEMSEAMRTTLQRTTYGE